MTDIPTISFEAVKTSITQTKDGVILRLAVHPSEVPPELFRSWVGSRYQCVLVLLDDEDQPTETAADHRISRAIQSAGLMPRLSEFYKFLASRGRVPADVPLEQADMERASTDALRNMLGVKSRAELRHNSAALDKFLLLQADFRDYQRRFPDG